MCKNERDRTRETDKRKEHGVSCVNAAERERSQSQSSHDDPVKPGQECHDGREELCVRMCYFTSSNSIETNKAFGFNVRDPSLHPPDFQGISTVLSLVSDPLDLLHGDLAGQQSLSHFEVLKLDKLVPSFLGVVDGFPDLFANPDISMPVKHTGVVILVLHDRLLFGKKSLISCYGFSLIRSKMTKSFLEVPCVSIGSALYDFLQKIFSCQCIAYRHNDSPVGHMRIGIWQCCE